MIGRRSATSAVLLAHVSEVGCFCLNAVQGGWQMVVQALYNNTVQDKQLNLALPDFFFTIGVFCSLPGLLR